jgi:hypothetical protein
MVQKVRRSIKKRNNKRKSRHLRKTIKRRNNIRKSKKIKSIKKGGMDLNRTESAKKAAGSAAALARTASGQRMGRQQNIMLFITEKTKEISEKIKLLRATIKEYQTGKISKDKFDTQIEGIRGQIDGVLKDVPKADFTELRVELGKLIQEINEINSSGPGPPRLRHIEAKADAARVVEGMLAEGNAAVSGNDYDTAVVAFRKGLELVKDDEDLKGQLKEALHLAFAGRAKLAVEAQEAAEAAKKDAGETQDRDVRAIPLNTLIKLLRDTIKEYQTEKISKVEFNTQIEGIRGQIDRLLMDVPQTEFTELREELGKLIQEINGINSEEAPLRINKAIAMGEAPKAAAEAEAAAAAMDDAELDEQIAVTGPEPSSAAAMVDAVAAADEGAELAEQIAAAAPAPASEAAAAPAPALAPAPLPELEALKRTKFSIPLLLKKAMNYKSDMDASFPTEVANAARCFYQLGLGYLSTETEDIKKAIYWLHEAEIAPHLVTCFFTIKDPTRIQRTAVRDEWGVRILNRKEKQQEKLLIEEMKEDPSKIWTCLFCEKKNDNKDALCNICKNPRIDSEGNRTMDEDMAEIYEIVNLRNRRSIKMTKEKINQQLNGVPIVFTTISKSGDFPGDIRTFYEKKMKVSVLRAESDIGLKVVLEIPCHQGFFPMIHDVIQLRRRFKLAFVKDITEYLKIDNERITVETCMFDDTIYNSAKKKLDELRLNHERKVDDVRGEMSTLEITTEIQEIQEKKESLKQQMEEALVKGNRKEINSLIARGVNIDEGLITFAQQYQQSLIILIQYLKDKEIELWQRMEGFNVEESGGESDIGVEDGDFPFVSSRKLMKSSYGIPRYQRPSIREAKHLQFIEKLKKGSNRHYVEIFSFESGILSWINDEIKKTKLLDQQLMKLRDGIEYEVKRVEKAEDYYSKMYGPVQAAKLATMTKEEIEGFELSILINHATELLTNIPEEMRVLPRIGPDWIPDEEISREIEGYGIMCIEELGIPVGKVISFFPQAPLKLNQYLETIRERKRKGGKIKVEALEGNMKKTKQRDKGKRIGLLTPFAKELTRGGITDITDNMVGFFEVKDTFEGSYGVEKKVLEKGKIIFIQQKVNEDKFVYLDLFMLGEDKEVDELTPEDITQKLRDLRSKEIRKGPNKVRVLFSNAVFLSYVLSYVEEITEDVYFKAVENGILMPLEKKTLEEWKIEYREWVYDCNLAIAELQEETLKNRQTVLDNLKALMKGKKDEQKMLRKMKMGIKNAIAVSRMPPRINFLNFMSDKSFRESNDKYPVQKKKTPLLKKRDTESFGPQTFKGGHSLVPGTQD